MFYLLLTSAAGGAASGGIGGITTLVLCDRSIIRGWTFWFVTELVNYVAILPVVLFAPAPLAFRELIQTTVSWRWADIPPVAALLLSFLVAVLIGGPGLWPFWYLHCLDAALSIRSSRLRYSPYF